MIHSISLPHLLDLSLSRSSVPQQCVIQRNSLAVQQQEKGRDRERLRCVVGFIYTNEKKWNKKKRILAQFLCDIIHYMLLMFDL